MGIYEKVTKKRVSTDSPSLPYVIAEAGVNHEGNMSLARRLVDEAARGGADAIKFQTYRAHTICSRYSPAYWDTDMESTASQFELFRKYDKFWKEEYGVLKEYCDELGIEFLSTPFDLESAVFLNELMDVFKISSSDITNRPFIEFICDFGKPVLLSTGASDLDEIDHALEWIDAKEIPVALMHCVLNYPTPDSSANLRMILGLRKRYSNHVIGYSDHTLPADMRTLETAYVLGAEILEKHFTHDKSLPGNDHYHAMDIEDLRKLSVNIRRIHALLGTTEKHSLPSEVLARQHARRSLVAACDISLGSEITEEMLTWKRPGHGISPAKIFEVVGRRASQEIQEDNLLTWDMLQ